MIRLTEHEPRRIFVKPEKIIPHHDSESTYYWKSLYRRKLLYLIPPIPVVKAPEDLKDLGDYINYNGHHRTKSAAEVRVTPECFLIESDEDLAYLDKVSEIYEEIIGGLGRSFNRHYAFVSGEARKYMALQKLELRTS